MSADDDLVLVRRGDLAWLLDYPGHAEPPWDAQGRMVKAMKSPAHPAPGTWAWACARMLEGRSVQRPVKRHGIRAEVRAALDHERVLQTWPVIDGDVRWGGMSPERDDLEATDWRVVE